MSCWLEARQKCPRCPVDCRSSKDWPIVLKQDVFPFFIGFQRSGTTLLRAMFNAHPEVAIPYEGRFLEWLRFPWIHQRYETKQGFATEIFVSDLFRDPNFGSWQLNRRQVLEALEEPASSLSVNIRRVYALYAAMRGKKRYADKTAGLNLQVPFVSSLFPEARFIHIIRDGRNVALAWRDAPWNIVKAPAEVALNWAASVEIGRMTGQLVGRMHYREIRYESLIDDPEGSLREVCKFLEITFDQAMLAYHECPDEVVNSDPFPQAQKSLHLPPTKGLRDWSRHMPKKDLRDFEKVAGDALQRFGYDLSTRN